jgi:prolyl-tRNA synthetase
MTHGDDDGVIMPPRLAPSHIVLMPILKKADQASKISEFTENLARELRQITYHGRKIGVEIDNRDIGGRGWEWIKKGIPLRVEIGPRDLAENAVCVGRRDKPHREKVSLKRDAFVKMVPELLDEIHRTLYDRALTHRNQHTQPMNDKAAFYDYFTPKNPDKPEIHGGFALSHWCGDRECEEKIKNDLSVTIRCIPLDAVKEAGKCVICGNPSGHRVVFAKSY